MTNRFEKSSPRSQRSLPFGEGALALLLCLGAALLMWIGLRGVAAASHSQRMRSLEQAVRRATVQCYALEGRYPPSLAHLEEHYGLLLQQDAFVVHYEPSGENLMPVIKVLPLEGGDAP